MLFRIHLLRHIDHLLYFGVQSEGRFRAPNGEYGVLYAGLDFHGAFVETFGRELGPRVVRQAELAHHCLIEIHVTAPLRLVNLTGAALRRLGADTRVTTGDYRVARRWAAALWAHAERPDGLFWRSRFDDDRYCVAIFDRARSALTATNRGPLDSSANAPTLADVLDAYGYALL